MDPSLLPPIVDALNGSLSPDTNTRMTAELALSKLMERGETGLGLATLLVSSAVELSTRQIRTVLQRKYVLEHWSPFYSAFKGNAPSVELKSQIRDLVFQGLSDPVRKIRSISGFALSTILQSDWPDECPEFLNSLLTLLSSGVPDSVDGAMRLFAEFIKGDLAEDQLLPVLTQLLPVLLNILGEANTHSSLTRSRVLSVFNECVQTLFMVKDQHPDSVKHATDEILPTWVNALQVLLEIPITNDLQSQDWDGLILRYHVFKVLDQIQLSFPRAMTTSGKSHALLTISLDHLFNLLPVFRQYYTDPASDVHPPGTSEDPSDTTVLSKLGCSIFQFIQTSSRAGPSKPWFLAHGILNKLVGAVIGWTQMTTEEVENWTNDANAFVSDENDDEAWTLRAAGFDLMEALVTKLSGTMISTIQSVSHQVVQESMQARDGGQVDWWKLLESSLATMAAISEELCEVLDTEEEGSKSFDLEFWLVNVVPSVLGLGDLPFLQGRGFVFASKFAEVLPPHLFAQYLNAALGALEAESTGAAVKLSAVRALRNFSTQKPSADAVVPLAPRMASNLAPFLLVTSEDTLALVVEALLSVIEIDQSKWMTPDVASPLIGTLMQVWVKNVRDPILLSSLTDIFVALAKCPTPGVYQSVVTSTLPSLSTAIAEAKPSETWITSSAIDLATSLMRGAKKGELGEGFFHVLGPALFSVLLGTEDREIVQNGIECLTFVIRKGCDQLMNYVSPSTGESGLTLILQLVAKFLAPSADNLDGVVAAEAGGLFIGDMIVHLLRNASGSEQLRAVLPDMMGALVRRIDTAKTATFLQSLIIPLAYLVHTQSDVVLDLLETMPVGTKNGLEVLIRAWCENADTFQGFWPSRISTLALCDLFVANRPSLQALHVQGDLIIKPETKNVIVTRSRSKTTPHEYTSIPFHVRALKLILQDLQSSGDDALAVAEGKAQSRTLDPKDVKVDVDLDEEPDAEGDEWADEEDLYQGLKAEELGFLSDLLDGDADNTPKQGDDDDLKEDPINQLDMRSYLLNFVRQAAGANVNDFSRIADGLSVEEIAVLRLAVNG